MAALVLSTIGKAVGARIFPAALSTIGASLGQAAGAVLGGAIDQTLFGQSRSLEGPRLAALHVQGSTEGASIPAVYGRVRIAGQVIWAARFKEHVSTQEVQSGGKGGGGSTKVTNFAYSLSFAIGLCEGEIARIGRVWANGEAFDLSQCAWRLYQGSETQAPDPLFEAIEGAENAPAYRGLAYIVFEDLPLDAFGNTIPQLSFEIVRPAGGGQRLETMARGVCLIPGAGEFVLATGPVRRVIGPGRETAENVHAEEGRANLAVALDHLAADLPACESVLLVVSWFGTDLRCGACEIRPGVEIAAKETSSLTWSVNGVSRAGAHLISLHDGAPAYGGTPDDATVVAAIQDLKARGYKVGLYPFVLMDVPAGNGLPDPYGAAEQAAYPWRGRVTLHPAPGHAGTPDKTGAATAQIAAFFGAAAGGDFAVSGGSVSYGGPAEWSYRRFILHYAKLAAAAGGVDALILGSEMRGLTTARDSAAHFPAVDALKALAGDVRGIIGGAAKLTYGADWSEYRGHQPDDGTGDVFFHLDPLWADAAVDCVGVDWYPPLSDWREGAAHLDAALARSDHDPAYLQSRIEAGEDYDFFYASDADRDAQTRTPISDGAYGEPWVFRAKDLRAFWANAHYNRPGGVRSGAPTDWVPQSKPIWFVELGCPAIDKGANAPNLFIDPKSDESGQPPYSSGARDDLIQRRALEAYLSYWGGPANPISSLYHAPMIEPDGVFLWAWDARPFPAFPARADVWADGPAWRRGHWLSGRAGLATLADVAADLCLRAGVTDADVARLSGIVGGYVIDAPSSARAALEPLMAAFDFDVREHGGALEFRHGADADAVALTLDDAADVSIADAFQTRGDDAETPIEARVRYLDSARDYLVGAVSARRRDAAEGGVETIDAPLVMDEDAAQILADRLLAQRRALMESAAIAFGPAQLALEPGDRVLFQDETFQIARIEDAGARTFTLQRVIEDGAAARSAGEANAPSIAPLAPTPAFAILDLPPLPGAEEDDRPLAAIAANPWRGAHAIYVGDAAASATRRGGAEDPAIMGELLWALWPGPVDRWDEGNRIRIKLYAGALESVSKEDVLAGVNAFAIECDDGEWEIIQARNAVLTGPDEYELSGFLRGLRDTGGFMGAPTPAGRRIVKLDTRLARLSIGEHEWGGALAFIAPPAGAGAVDAAAASQVLTLNHAQARPWRPAHLKAWRLAGGDVAVSWIRQARIGGENWGPGEPPLGEPTELYILEILDGGGGAVRTIQTASPSYLYSSADQSADFGAPPDSLRLRAAQIGANGLSGLKTESLIPL
ncbi:MAG: glycoside hydrolase/phage tail family protein [Hyphomonadaceae bacterium]